MAATKLNTKDFDPTKLKTSDKYQLLMSIFLGRQKNLPRQLMHLVAEAPDIRLVQSKPTETPRVFMMSPRTFTDKPNSKEINVTQAEEISRDYLADWVLSLIDWLSGDKDPDVGWTFQNFRFTKRQAREFVDTWVGQISHQATSRDFAQVVIPEDGKEALYFTDFIPTQVPLDDVLEMNLEQHCPTFAEILSRMGNAEAFLSRIGSIFDEKASRKQVVYLHGHKDSGKSVLMNILNEVAGGSDGSTGSYTILSPGAISSTFYKETLIGKRVVCVAEADPRFLNTEAFKSLTGDVFHLINPKGRPMYTARLNPLFFFFSNDPPEVDNKPEITSRIIYCPIEPVDFSKVPRLPEEEVLSKLRAELPVFVGICQTHWEMVRDQCAGFIPAEFDGLEEYLVNPSDFAVNFLEDYYEMVDGYVTPCHEVQRVFYRYVSKNQKEYTNVIKILKRLGFITEGKVRLNDSRIRAYIGIRFRGIPPDNID